MRSLFKDTEGGTGREKSRRRCFHGCHRAAAPGVHPAQSWRHQMHCTGRVMYSLRLSIGYHAIFTTGAASPNHKWLWGPAAGRGTFESILQCHHFSSGSGAAECLHRTTGAEWIIYNKWGIWQIWPRSLLAECPPADRCFLKKKSLFSQLPESTPAPLLHSGQAVGLAMHSACKAPSCTTQYASSGVQPLAHNKAELTFPV